MVIIMMEPRITLGLVCAALAVLLIGCSVLQPCLAGYPLSSYLKMPDESKLVAGPYHQKVSAALMKLKLEHDARPSEVLEAIKLASVSDESNEDDVKIYKTLLTLDDDEGWICPYELVDLTKSIWAQTRRPDLFSHVVAFRSFLKKYGRKKFALCTEMSLEWLDAYLYIGSSTLNRLDTFFKAALDDNLDSRLNELDMSREYLNIREMLARAKAMGAARAGDKTLAPIKNHLDNVCYSFKKQFARLLDIINLGTALGYSSKRANENASLIKLNDYNRICLEWTDPNKRQRIVENIEQRHRRNIEWDKISSSSRKGGEPNQPVNDLKNFYERQRALANISNKPHVVARRNGISRAPTDRSASDNDGSKDSASDVVQVKKVYKAKHLRKMPREPLVSVTEGNEEEEEEERKEEKEEGTKSGSKPKGLFKMCRKANCHEIQVA